MRQRIILIGLLGIGILVMFLRHWIRYVVIIPVGLGAIFTLSTMIFPLYNEGPNLTTFYKSQASTLHIIPGNDSSESKVTIQNNGAEQSLDTKKPSTVNITPSTNTIINFISTNKNNDTLVLLLLPEGTSIQIYPQTQITFLSTYPRIAVERKIGSTTTISSQNYSPRQLTLSGIMLSSGEKNQLQLTYEKKKIAAMQTQGGGIFMQYPYLKGINRRILETLTALRPASFQKNLLNFQAFEAYETIVIGRQTDTTVNPKIQSDIVVDAKKGFEETQIYQRWKKLF